MIKKLLVGMLYSPLIFGIGWFAASYLEVIVKNLSGSPLSFWNFFYLLG